MLKISNHYVSKIVFVLLFVEVLVLFGAAYAGAAVRLLDRATGDLRDQGRLHGLGQALALSSLARLAVGDLDRAVRAAQDAQRFSMSADEPAWGAMAEVTLGVAAALRGEGHLGGLIGGTPDWFWAGGMSSRVWLLTCLPAWIGESVLAAYWGVSSMAKSIAAAARAKQS